MASLQAILFLITPETQLAFKVLKKTLTTEDTEVTERIVSPHINRV